MIDQSSIDRAVEVLRRGGLVALPTETVYGLGADAQNELAVRRIFAVKRRPSWHPLIVHLPDASRLSDWARWVPESARRLAEAFWPGPLTMVLPRTERASDAVTGGQDTVALRVPAHPVALAVLEKFGDGIAAPSANRFGSVSPTTAEHVRQDLDDEVDFILDGGPCPVGVESTIVDLSGGSPSILRPGGIPREAIERVLGCAVPLAERSDVRAPGRTASHYAPKAGVVVAPAHALEEKARAAARRGQKVAVMSPAPVPGFPHYAVPADAAGFARALYATLREIDTAGYELIVVAEPPAEGLWLAVRDRLEKAAAPRT